MDAYIALETGQILKGRGRVSGRGHGELVFTTAYTGYEESLTDPSYSSQVLLFSYPLIGNYGVNEERMESNRVQPEVALAREFDSKVISWLKSQSVPAVDHIDTRSLVKHIRDKGVLDCGIACGRNVEPEDAIEELNSNIPIEKQSDIGSDVTSPNCSVYGSSNSGKNIALIDCGVKDSIIESFVERNATIYSFPFNNLSTDSIRDVEPDIIFVSNGPGDPKNYVEAQSVIKEFIGEIPISGICLGHQLISLCCGGRVSKLPFGHRGNNQPVRNLKTGKVITTAQNHGYHVTGGGVLKVVEINVNDNSIEGLESQPLSILTKQYHPEANPGPKDSTEFFDQVLQLPEPKMNSIHIPAFN